MSNYNTLNSPLSALPLATVQQWLQTALQAQMDLMTGGKVVTATYSSGDGTRTVSYSQPDLQMLQAWILQLQTFLGAGKPGRRGPIRALF